MFAFFKDELKARSFLSTAKFITTRKYSLERFLSRKYI